MFLGLVWGALYVVGVASDALRTAVADDISAAGKTASRLTVQRRGDRRKRIARFMATMTALLALSGVAALYALQHTLE